MDVISIYAAVEGNSHCPFCGDRYDLRGSCEICRGCFLCCWSHVHCFTCELPEVLCECVSCEDEESSESAKGHETKEGAA